MIDPDLLKTGLMLTALLTGFVAMSKYRVSQALVMPLVAMVSLTIAGTNAETMLLESVAAFAPIAMVFTAIAVCAHQIKRSGAFAVVGATIGSFVGHRGLRQPRRIIALATAIVLFLTWATAGMLHNVTSIMVMVPIVIIVCDSYHMPSRWLLCGALVASNLGGFSTAWGDTPNLIEARIWGLSHADFASEILPLNLICLAALTAVTAMLTTRQAKREAASLNATQIAMRSTAFDATVREIELDRRLLASGIVGLLGFIIAQGVSRELEAPAAALAIAFAVLADRPKHRLEALQSLGLDVYMTLFAVFVIAHGFSQSLMGAGLEQLIRAADGAIWAIAVSSYLGTLSTEAASWAAAAAPITHQIDSSRAAAWALGAGICAGSSSVLTAASAGIILWTESRRFKGHAIEFRDYLGFGLAASLLMLVYYIVAISVIAWLGGFQ